MSTETPFLFVKRPCEETISWALQQLEETGLQTARTFDLQVAREAGHYDCLCPHHGTERCDCQMVVVLVYPRKGRQKPATMVIHGHDQMSWFYLVNTPHHVLKHGLERVIKNVLSPSNPFVLSSELPPTIQGER